MGFRRGVHLHVVEHSDPRPSDRRARTRFRRESRGHATIALDRWRASGGVCDYVGEWHTHPERDPAPSTIDLREWALLLEAHQVPLLFVIVGTQSRWVGIGSGTTIRRVEWLLPE